MNGEEPDTAKETRNTEVGATAGNQSVAMSVRVLDEFARAGHSIGVSELARLMGESKGRVHRHLTTLKSLGLVSQEQNTERYGFGWKVFQWASAVGENFGIRRIAERFLTELRDATQQTAVYVIPADGEALVLASITCDARISIHVKHGLTVSAGGSALGRVVLAFSSAALQERVLARPLPGYTEASISDPKTLADRLALIRSRHYEFAHNENVHGIGTLAAPIFDSTGQIAGAIGIVGSTYSIRPDDPGTPQLVATVQECARRVSMEFGSHRWDSIPGANV